MKQLLFILTTIFFSSLFPACNKADNGNDTPVADTILTKEKLIGKWNVKSIAKYYYFNDSVTYSYTFDRWGEKRIDGNLMSYWQSYDYSFLTFNDRDSFYQSTPNGNGISSMLNVFFPESGTWSLHKDTLIMPHPDPAYTIDWKVMKYTGEGLYIRSLLTAIDSIGNKYEYDDHIVMEKMD